MASKRRVKRRQCSGKKKYADKAMAIREATRMRRAKIGQSFDAYQCETCGQWHVGHRTYKVKQKIAARRRETDK